MSINTDITTRLPIKGIANLTIRRPATADEPEHSAVTDMTPAVLPAGAKGGKGGKEGQPPSPPSNAEFLAAVLQNVPEGARAAICSKPGDPEAGGWIAAVASDVDDQCPSDRNNYLNCSTFLVDEDGGIQARKDRVAAYHVLVLDDVGTKIDRAKLNGFTPTYEIETSPGNSQIGVRLAVPITDPAKVKVLQDAASAADLGDPGAFGLARWVRLPNAINGKGKYRTVSGKPFATRLTQWNPDVAYTIEELATALHLDLNPRRTTPKASRKGLPTLADAARGDDVYTPAPAQNPVLSALRQRDLYKREIAPGKHEISCPWKTEHTDALDSGAAYFEPCADFPVGGFDCKHSHGDRYSVANLLEHLGLKPDQARGKARITIVAGELNRIRRAAERTLAQAGGYFQSGGAIVVIRTDPGSGDISTELLGEPALTAALSDAADWYRFDAQTKKPVRIDPPAKTVTFLFKAQQFDYLPALTGLARQPFFRDGGGQLVTAPGYDTASGRYAAFDDKRYAFPEPTEAAAREALALLDSLLDEFQFAGPVDRAAALCAMLTAAVRPSLPVAPAFNITASTPGSGKSYLASVIVPFTGPGKALKVSYPTTADEATKSMLSIFLGAPAAVLFDDMQSDWMPFGPINRALTSDTITDRVLGVSRTVTVGTRSLIMGTGNNVGPVRDMTRRVVTIRLHHQTATPALRSYTGKPADAVNVDREKYVAAALTIIRAWQAAGSPRADVPSIASYEAWSDMCRQPLIWLGQPDPVGSIIEQLVSDPDQDALGTFLKAWYAEFGDTPVALRKVVEAAYNAERLEDALMELPVTDRDSINRSKLGWYLKRNANRVVDGFELQPAFSSTRNHWRVVAVEPDPG